jgi:phosphopantothenoylcysteine synthetase/decarboxylase
VSQRTLCVVICGAGPADRVGRLVDLAQREGWTVRLVATPAGAKLIDSDALSAQCGTPVRSDYRVGSEPGPRASSADAIIVAPATFNSINKLAVGINDTYALNIVAEAIGRGGRVIIMPFVNSALAARKPFLAAVNSLRDEGVRVVLGPDQWMPHAPSKGGGRLDKFPWHIALNILAEMQEPSSLE